MPSCSASGRVFNSNEALIQHTESKHGKANVYRGVRLWEDSRNQMGELTTGHAVGRYEYEVGEDDYNSQTDTWDCGICGREFTSVHDLAQHLNSGVHEGALYRCQGCSRTFRNLGALNQHVTVTDCSSRAARQLRTLLSDADRQPGLVQLTDQSHRWVGRREPPPPEGTLFFDGGATPNPGRGGGGFYLVDERGEQVAREAVAIEPDTDVTSNQAEYVGLITGLLEAERQGMRRLEVRGDSELVINQMKQTYETLHPKLTPLNTYASQIERRFMDVTYTHIPRWRNRLADALANDAQSDGDETMQVLLRLQRNPPVECGHCGPREW